MARAGVDDVGPATVRAYQRGAEPPEQYKPEHGHEYFPSQGSHLRRNSYVSVLRGGPSTSFEKMKAPVLEGFFLCFRPPIASRPIVPNQLRPGVDIFADRYAIAYGR